MKGGAIFMKDKVIYIDFTRIKRRTKKESLFTILQNILRKIFSSPTKPSDPNKEGKIIYYSKDIS